MEPESGVTEFISYNALGKVIEYRDENGRASSPGYRIVSLYDAKGRVTGISRFEDEGDGAGPGELMRSFFYDGEGVYEKGKLKRAEEQGVFGLVTSFYSYGGLSGRLSQKEMTIEEGGSYKTSYRYDDLGNISEISYPVNVWEDFDDNRTLKYSYRYNLLDKVGTPSDPSLYVSSLTYHPSGGVSVKTNGNLTTDTIARDVKGRPLSIAGVNASDEVIFKSGAYSYDGAGNITEIGKEGEEGVLPESYFYDPLSRLASADIGGYKVSYSYDLFGNMTSRCLGEEGCSENAPPPGTFEAEVELKERGYEDNRISDPGGFHEAVEVRYDGNGNLSGWGSDSYTYDEFDRMVLAEASGKVMIYVYDHDGNRVLKGVASEGDGSSHTIAYIRGADGKVLSEYERKDDAMRWKKDYIYAQGMHAATLERREDCVRTLFYHPDHLGTPRAVTDESGALVSLHDYTPFGVEMPSSTASEETHRFTGHERDRETSLDYMMARFYSPRMTRFLSVDPDSGSAAFERPQTWNRYSYTVNNPLRYIDPDGEDFLDYLGGVANGLGSSMLFNLMRIEDPPNEDFAEGQFIGDITAVATSVLEVVVGSGMETGGAYACLTGEGALVGVPAAAIGIIVEAHGAASSVVATTNLMRSASNRNQGGDSQKKPSSPGQMQKEVERGKAPKDVKRVEKGHTPGQEDHVHYKDGTSSTKSGKVHDKHKGEPKPSGKTKTWLEEHGWKTPEP